MRIHSRVNGVYNVYNTVIARIPCSMLRRTARSILTPAFTRPGSLQCRSLFLTTGRANLGRPRPLRAHLFDNAARAGAVAAAAQFHSTPRRDGLPLILAGMASVLKVRCLMTVMMHAGSTRLGIDGTRDY